MFTKARTGSTTELRVELDGFPEETLDQKSSMFDSLAWHAAGLG